MWAGGIVFLSFEVFPAVPYFERVVVLWVNVVLPLMSALLLRFGLPAGFRGGEHDRRRMRANVEKMFSLLPLIFCVILVPFHSFLSLYSAFGAFFFSRRASPRVLFGRFMGFFLSSVSL